MLTVRWRGVEVRNAHTSILPLLSRLHIVLQGGKAGGVSVHSHGSVLVVFQVLSTPGRPLLVSLKGTRAEGSM